MIISCPECSGKFRVAAEALGESGRKVRCKSCRHTWFQTPDAEIEIAAPAVSPDINTGISEIPENIVGPSEVAPEPVNDDFIEPGKVRSKKPKGFAPEKAKKKGKGVLVGWLLFFALAGGLGYGFWSERVLIVKTVPEAMKLYELLDLQVFLTGEGLKIENQKFERATKDGTKLIVVTGEIVNVTNEKIIIPKLIGSLRANTGEALSRKTISPSVKFLGPEEKTEFFIELISTPKAIQADVNFVSDEEALQTPDFDPIDK
ncbi:zinc-ribbon domain-containing protein [Kiloniella antarctica]|uniref:Zinc-ribbon domain-containing protein n=1 Tax=Kiloniella antarctica TaxID=1550907 RepID=A0ABW5BEA4_9PROT